MSRILTGDKLVESVRNRTMTPDDTSIFTDQDILDIVNEELDVQILDKLLALHEEHLTICVDIPRNTEGIYDIPYRAIGNKLRDVSLIQGASTYELSQISIGELSDYRLDIDSGSTVDKFYVKSNGLHLVNPTRSYDFIRMWFYIRPNVLTKENQAGVISSIIDNGDETITLGLSSVGKNFVLNSEYDIVGKRTPNKIKGYDLQPIEVNTGSSGFLKFNKADIEDILSDIKVGDYATLSEQTPVPNIPTEFHPVLAQAGAIHILESLGDTEALRNAEARMMKMTTAVQQLVDDRIELAPKKIKSRHGTLRQAMGRGRRKGSL